MSGTFGVEDSSTMSNLTISLSEYCAMPVSVTVLPFARVAIATILLSSTVAGAQIPGGGGRQRGGGEKSGMPRSAPERSAATHGAVAVDPIAAINRELPSLKVDLKIAPEQLSPWDAFSASVREANNISINRAKRDAMARPRDDRAKPDVTDAPPALAMITALADDDAQRAEAMGLVKSKVALLVEALTPEQRRMFDRRIAQAQREPLGGF
jgi:hypothetical protein